MSTHHQYTININTPCIQHPNHRYIINTPSTTSIQHPHTINSSSTHHQNTIHTLTIHHPHHHNTIHTPSNHQYTSIHHQYTIHTIDTPTMYYQTPSVQSPSTPSSRPSTPSHTIVMHIIHTPFTGWSRRSLLQRSVRHSDGLPAPSRVAKDWSSVDTLVYIQSFHEMRTLLTFSLKSFIRVTKVKLFLLDVNKRKIHDFSGCSEHHIAHGAVTIETSRKCVDRSQLTFEIFHFDFFFSLY